MTGMLASVNSLEEALLIKSVAVDIIDLKQPAEGALGALSPNSVQQIVAEIDGHKPVSATVGDLPMQPETVFRAVESMAATGVDFVKIGFFPGHDWEGTIDKLSALTINHALIAVLFADKHPDFKVIKLLHMAGFNGVMLDTMNKHHASLLTAMTKDEIRNFVRSAKKHGLLTGLAGSLKETDITGLLALEPDYLGFRGALCEQLNRVARLDKEKVLTISSYFSAPYNSVPEPHYQTHFAK